MNKIKTSNILRLCPASESLKYNAKQMKNIKVAFSQMAGCHSLDW